jgi:uncharacterized membrane protein (UPF0182 family)
MPDTPELEIIDLSDEAPRKLPWGKITALFAILFILFLTFHNGVPLYIDALWFKEVGYTSVFTTQIIAKTLLFFGFGAVWFAVLYGNITIARRMASDEANRQLLSRFGAEWSGGVQRALGIVILLVTLFLSLWAGRLAANQWADFLTFQNATPFGKTDPVFGIDIGFYIFRLPFWQYLHQFLLSLVVFSTIAVVLVHVADRAVESLAGLPNVAPRIQKHLLVLGAAFALLLAWKQRLAAYGLLVADNGVFHGAGYSDLHYRLLGLNVQMVVLVVTALLCLVALGNVKWMRLCVVGGVTWAVVAVVMGAVVPTALQKWVVVPNQFTMEQPYIQQNITSTRQGFGLEDVKHVDNFPANESLDTVSLRNNRQTLSNIRLWDHNYLARVYSQNQTVKTYYKFEQTYYGNEQPNNIDIDRYRIGGELRQVMLGAREMDNDSLPPTAQTWQNRRLGYTHGYGAVMSPVNKVVDGLPTYFLQGIPPRATPPQEPALKLDRPEIYYGLLNTEYVFVDTEQQEFDYPATDTAGGKGGSQDHYTTYQGKGGIVIGNHALAKLAFSAFLGDTNILLSRSFKPSTRVLFRREVRERVHLIAPFLQLDSDPYLVVAEGRMVWILDAYTISDRYPYATPLPVFVTPFSRINPNYIRNSVKITVDAYDGAMNLYLSDPKDPIAQTYNKAFGNILKPLSEMPASLREHIRYPEDLFRLQRTVYATYHVDDPRVFYLKEDAWAIPNQPSDSGGVDPKDRSTSSRGMQMEPYYVVMRLPEAKQEEFLLMSPMSPINREDKNMLGWMCARCDGENYGQLVLYRFPQQASVNGPAQVISLINSDPIISPQLSLLRQGGSEATFGNLLILPIEKSLLAIAPLYIEASSSAKLPQLQKVVVVFGQRAVMENTLEAALERLFAGYGAEADKPSGKGISTSVVPTGTTLAVPPAVRSLIDLADTDYQKAQQQLRAGDFGAYGATLKELERTIKELKRVTGSPSPK